MVIVVVTGPVTKPVAGRLVADHRDQGLLVVAPVLLGRLQYWTGDDGKAREEAAARLTEWLDALTAGGVDARGFVGDTEPLQLIEDALALAGSGEVVVTTSGADHWQVRGLARRARDRVSVPVVELPDAYARAA